MHTLIWHIYYIFVWTHVNLEQSIKGLYYQRICDPEEIIDYITSSV